MNLAILEKLMCNHYTSLPKTVAFDTNLVETFHIENRNGRIDGSRCGLSSRVNITFGGQFVKIAI